MSPLVKSNRMKTIFCFHICGFALFVILTIVLPADSFLCKGDESKFAV